MQSAFSLVESVSVSQGAISLAEAAVFRVTLAEILAAFEPEMGSLIQPFRTAGPPAGKENACPSHVNL